MSIIPGIEIAAPERTETSSGSAASPKRLPVFSSSRPHVLGDLGRRGPSGRSPRRHVGAAGVGRDREAGRDGQPERGHLGEADPLAAEQLAAAVGGLVEVVDEACRCGHRADCYHVSGARRARNSASQASERSANQNGVKRP